MVDLLDSCLFLLSYISETKIYLDRCMLILVSHWVELVGKLCIVIRNSGSFIIIVRDS